MSKRGQNEGSIYKRDDGLWVAVVNLGHVDGKRKRKYLYGDTRSEVKDKLAAALHDQQQGVLVTTDRQTIEQFLTRWLDESAQLRIRPRTYRSYKQLMRLYLLPDLGSIELAKLTPQDVQRFVNQRLQSGLSSRTVRYAHAVLRRALNQAVKWGLTSRNVATLVDLPRQEHMEQDFLTADEARKLLQVVRGDRLEALYSVAIAIGLRKSEALGLRWKDIDFAAQTVSIQVSLQWVNGDAQLDDLKTKRSHRIITLPDFAVVSLLKHQHQQADEAGKAGSTWHNDFGLVFTTHTGTPFHDIHVSRYFRSMLSKAGIRRIRFYDLRHTCASLLIAQGVHPRVIMDILGHSDITMTMNIYGHIMQASRNDAAQTMHDLLYPPAE